MMRSVLSASALASVLLLGTQAAQAGGCYGSSCRPAPCQGASCYTLVQTPLVYGTVNETFVARPARSQAQVIPAEYDYVTEKVMVHPARQIPRHRPAQYSTVTEKVMVSRGGKRWEVTTDTLDALHTSKVWDKLTDDAQAAVDAAHAEFGGQGPVDPISDHTP